MKKIIIAGIFFVPLFLLIAHIKITNDRLPELNSLNENAKICLKQKCPSKILKEALLTALKKQKRPVTYTLLKILYKKNIFSHDSFDLQYGLAQNLLKNFKSSNQLEMALMTVKIAALTENDDQIFCLYLSSLTHNNLVGAPNIATYFFNHSIDYVTLTEAVRIAAMTTIPQDPFSHQPEYKALIHKILIDMFRRNVISEEDYRLSLDEFK